MGDRSFQMERVHRTRDQNKFRTQKTEGRLEKYKYSTAKEMAKSGNCFQKSEVISNLEF